MAEALAVGASVIAVTQLADRVIELCRFYLGTAKDAPSNLRLTLNETSTLRIILENVEFLKNTNDDMSTTVQSLTGKDGPIEGVIGVSQSLRNFHECNICQKKVFQDRRSRKFRLRSQHLRGH